MTTSYIIANLLVADAAPSAGGDFFSHNSVWAALFALLLLLIIGYVLHRIVLSRARKKMDEERLHMQREHEREKESLRQQVLSGVSQELLTPITLIISPLQQIASEALSDDVKGRVQMILRSTQLLLHQVNMFQK